jgi:hypothetical protein
LPPFKTVLQSHELDADLYSTVCIHSGAVIEKVTRGDDPYEWHLTEVERAKKFRKPAGDPQPVWFNPI